MREADQHQVRQHLDVVVVDQSGDVWGRWVSGRVGSMGRGTCRVDGSGAGGRGVDRLTLQHGGGAEMREADQHQVRQHLDVVVVDQATLDVTQKLEDVESVETRVEQRVHALERRLVANSGNACEEISTDDTRRLRVCINEVIGASYAIV